MEPLVVDKGGSMSALVMKNEWEQRDGRNASTEAAYKAFSDGGSVSATSFIQALKARAAKHLNLIIVDLRELATEGKESNGKIVGALESGMPNSDPHLPDFDQFRLDYPKLFPANQGGLPDAVIFYCYAGANRSPAMACAYTLWMHQRFNAAGNHAVNCHSCYLGGGMGTFLNTKVTIGELGGLQIFENYQQVANPIPQTNIRNKMTKK